MGIVLEPKARYVDDLQDLLNEVGAEKILNSQIQDDYSGAVDVSALLKDGRVFSYQYY
jgi:hypothetical protein